MNAADAFEAFAQAHNFRADVVLHALDVAANRFDDNANVCVVAEQAQLAHMFRRYADDTRQVLALLRGDDEPERETRPALTVVHEDEL